MSDPVKLAIISGVVSVLCAIVTSYFAYRTKRLTGQVQQMHNAMQLSQKYSRNE